MQTQMPTHSSYSDIHTYTHRPILMYKHTDTYIHTYNIHTHIHTYIYIHTLHTYIIYNNIHQDIHTGPNLHNYPRCWEASLPGKVFLTSIPSSLSGSYYPRLMPHKGEGIPFQGCCPSLCAGPSMQISPPSSLTTGGGIEICRLCYIG